MVRTKSVMFLFGLLLLFSSNCGDGESGSDKLDVNTNIAPNSSLIGDWALTETVQDASCSEISDGLTNEVQITVTESECQLRLETEDQFGYSDDTGCVAGGNDIQVIIKATFVYEGCTLSVSETISGSLDANEKIAGSFSGSIKTSGKCAEWQKVNCSYSGPIAGVKK